MYTVTTNTWENAESKKPWRNRNVLVLFDDGTLGIAKWNGMYWTGQHDMRFIRQEEITHFYIFDKPCTDNN